MLSTNEVMMELLKDEGITDIEDDAVSTLMEEFLCGTREGSSPTMCAKCHHKDEMEPDIYEADCGHCGDTGCVYALNELLNTEL